MTSEVYFSGLNDRTREESFAVLLENMDQHLSQFSKGAAVGIKMTVGDEKNSAYIKPGLVRILVDELLKRGARPFVFDTNVIYKGQRQNAVDHLNLAYRKGFTPENLGCPYIIADSVFGTDSRTFEVDFNRIKEIRVPSLVGVLDDLIVLSHITGHIMEGYAASVKNVAMGMASRAGKQVQHSSLKPVVNSAYCTLCGCCFEICPVSAISEEDGSAFINHKVCTGCAECIASCQFDAIKVSWRENMNIFAERMAEYASGILSLIKRKMFINFALDVTEECDCISNADDPKIVEDAGIFASDDILAVDKACYDALTVKEDVFSRQGKISTHVHQFEYARKTGLGSLDYRLVRI